MRTIARIISALTVALSALVTVPTAAQADTPGYVSGAELQRIGRGMDIRRVHRIFCKILCRIFARSSARSAP